MPMLYETIEQVREFDFPGLGKIVGKGIANVPQFGYAKKMDESGAEIEVFEEFDLEEILNTFPAQTDKEGKVTKTSEEIVCGYLNAGIKQAMRSGAYASAGSLSDIGNDEKETKAIKSLKKSIDSFVKDFGMTEDQAAAAVRNVPAIKALIDDLVERKILIPKDAPKAG